MDGESCEGVRHLKIHAGIGDIPAYNSNVRAKIIRICAPILKIRAPIRRIKASQRLNGDGARLPNAGLGQLVQSDAWGCNLLKFHQGLEN